MTRYQYTYDANGNRLTQTETHGNQTIASSFVYDKADRLTAITEPDKHTAYTLDGSGNRVEVREGATVLNAQRKYTAEFNVRNQITEQKQYADNAVTATTSFHYDPNGNLIRQSTGGADTQWRYDVVDRLIETTPPTGPPTQYKYGPSDVRTAKIRNGVEVRYHYDGERIALETNAIGNPQRHYAYSAAGLLNTTLLGTTPQYRSAHLDAMGSPVLITGSDGGVLTRTRFDAWGVEHPIFGTRDQAIAFQGYWSGIELEETGTLLSAARLYIPSLGIFAERDPVEGTALEPISFNPYLLGRANPHYWMDPDGRCSVMMETSRCHDELARINRIERDRADGAYLQVDSSTPEGMAVIEQYRAERQQSAQDSLASNLMDGFVFVMDGFATIYEMAGGDELGARERMTERAINFRDWSAAPIDNTMHSIMQGADARGEAHYRRDYSTLAKMDGEVATNVTLAVVGAITPGAAAFRVGGRMPDAPKPNTHRLTEAKDGPGGCCVTPNCFAAGTLVHTAHGLKPIEQVRAGEIVYARDEATTQNSLQPVLLVHERHGREVLDLGFEDPSGVEERITVTADHRFHSAERGWTRVDELAPGEVISSLDGRVLTLITRAPNPVRTTVYTFTIKEDPNYFVGSSGLWVHNAPCVPCPASPVSQYISGVRSFATPRNTKANLFEIEHRSLLNDQGL